MAVTGSAFPARMKIGMPAQRQFSISRRSATKVSVSDFGCDALDLPVPLVLPEHRFVGIGRRHRPEDVEPASGNRILATRRRLHRGESEDLE